MGPYVAMKITRVPEEVGSGQWTVGSEETDCWKPAADCVFMRRLDDFGVVESLW